MLQWKDAFSQIWSWGDCFLCWSPKSPLSLIHMSRAVLQHKNKYTNITRARSWERAMPEHSSLSRVLFPLGILLLFFLLIKLDTTSPLLTPISSIIQKGMFFCLKYFHYRRDREKKSNALEIATKTRLFNVIFFFNIKSQLLPLYWKGLSVNSVLWLNLIVSF